MKDSLLRKFYHFNLYNRDKWVSRQAKAVEKGHAVLDVGAGSAPYRSLFSHCNYKTHDFAQLEDHQLRGYKGYHKIDYVSDITNIPVAENSFDTVICTEVIEHVPEPIAALKEMIRVLKPGGTLLLTAPLGSGLHQEPYHFYGGYTPYWYEKFLIENNMHVVSIEGNSGFYSFFGQELIRFVTRSAPWKSLFNLLLLPFWILCLPVAIIFPLIAGAADRNSSFKDFTIGYHVIATKQGE